MPQLWDSVKSMLAVVETPEFIRRSRSSGMTDEEKAELISALAADPEAGISLGGGLRKVRFARTGAGKSGGYRVIHFYRSRDMPLSLSLSLSLSLCSPRSQKMKRQTSLQPNALN